MNLYFRLFFLLLFSSFKQKEHYNSTFKTTLRVLPTDLDLNMHMNNARYLSMMDLGRIDFMLRSGLLKKAIKRKWAPIVANIDISYYKSLNPWEKYTLETKLESYDEKYFYLSQIFIRKDGKEAARAHVKGLFLKGRQKITPKEVLEIMDKKEASE